jgi:hypothetical protein
VRSPARVPGLVALALALAPAAASACAVCADSAWGNRGFGWPFVALMLTPFAVVAGLVGALAWILRRVPPEGRRPTPP